MKSKLFKDVSEVLSARLSLSLVTSFLLAALAISQQFYINSRAEIVIERPMFSQDREMKYIRDKMTRDVALVWAYNAALIFGNINQQSIDLVDSISYSFVDSNLAQELKLAHEEQLVYMKEQQVNIRFIPDGAMKYNEKTGWVSVSGTRIISPLNTLNTSDIIKQNYMFEVKLSMTDFRPWVSGWKEGAI